MNKQLLIALIIILVGGGIYGIYRSTQKPATDTTSEVESMQTPTEQKDTMQQDEAKTTDSTAGCVRNVDENVLKTAKVETKNQFVTMDVKGFGSIKVQLYDQDAPKTVENFLRLTNAGYYNCITFHRVAKGFVIQGGDPTGTGSGGDSAFGGEFADELNPSALSYKTGYKKGVLAMANRGPNTNTSQFFIMLGDVELPKNYTIFGKVTVGLDVVDKIGAVEIIPQMGATDGKPVEPIVIEKATISAK